MYSEEITGIVVDMGSQSVRAGYSGDDSPRYVLPSRCMIRDKQRENVKMEIEEQPIESEESRKGYASSDLFFGDEYLNVKKDNAAIRELVGPGGEIADYELLEQGLQHIFGRLLRLTPDQFPLIMSEPMGVSIQQRQKLTEMVFESLQATNYFTCKSPVLSSFSCGKGASLVIDSGHTATWAVPVIDGYALQKNAIRFPIGGNYLNNKVIQYVEKTYNNKLHPRFCYQSTSDKEGNRVVEYTGPLQSDPSFYDYQKTLLGQQIKEQLLYIDEEELMQKPDRNTMMLPDGTQIQLGEYRSTLVESLFSPFQRKKHQDVPEALADFKGLHSMVIDSINSSDIDSRKDLLNNVLLVGGNTLIPGLDDLFNRRLIEIAPPNAKVKLITHPNSLERLFAPWIGASILSSLGSFQNMWIGKQEYEEHGSYIINKKCP